MTRRFEHEVRLTRRQLLKTGSSAAVACGWMLVPGCGGARYREGISPQVTWEGVDVVSGMRIRLVPRAMPYGTTCTGTYQSPQMGHIEVEQHAGRLLGRYERTHGGFCVTGELIGELAGNLARFDWRERVARHTAQAEYRGRGYFLFDPASTPNQGDRLFGMKEIVHRTLLASDDDRFVLDTGFARGSLRWTAVKQG